MEDFITRFWENLLGRFDGPLHFRLIMQPAMAVFLAVRSALRDAREGHPPFFWALLTGARNRRELLLDAWRDGARLFIFAIVLDAIYQLIVLHWFYPGEALLVAAVLAFIPYVVVRDIVYRVAVITSRARVKRSS